MWLFDLDNTLHDASHAIFAAIDGRMTEYMTRELALARDEADRLRAAYWRRYGATLAGLVRHHGVQATHFLQATHDFDAAALVRAERGLTQLFRRLPGRKILLTNAPHAYAGSVLRKLALHRHFGTRYTIERMHVHGSLRPKPSKSMLRALLARERVKAADAVLVEDTIGNLKAARALGLRTVLITRHGLTRQRARRAGPMGRGTVGLRIASLRELARRRPR